MPKARRGEEPGTDRKVDRNEVKRLAAMLRLGDAGLTPGNRQQTGCINKARPQRH